jgi:prolipoprotein diacylglyceryl transferase
MSPTSVVAFIPSPPFNTIEIGPLTFRLYGLMIALGVLAAVEIARRRWEAVGGSGDDIADLAKWGVPAGLIGARLYHVITDWKSFRGRWIDVFKIWQGGLGIPGGLILGVGVGLWYARRRGWDVARLADCVIPGIPVAQAIGRLGNWFNQEVYGKPSTLPWALEIDAQYRPDFPNNSTFHPTFLYEGLFNLALAYVLIRIDRKKILKPGQLLPLWIAGYGFGRFLVESLRSDFASQILGVRVNHWVAGIAVVVGTVWFIVIGRRPDPSDHGSDPGPGNPDAASTDAGDPDPSEPTEIESDEIGASVDSADPAP